MKLVGAATSGLTASYIFAYGPRESNGGHAPKGALLHGGSSHTSHRREARAAPADAVYPAVPALVCEAAGEKRVRGEIAGDLGAMPNPVGSGASLSIAPLSALEIEKLAGEL